MKVNEKLLNLLKPYMQKIGVGSVFVFTQDFVFDIFNFKKGHPLIAVHLDTKYEDEFISEGIRGTLEIPSRIRKQGILKEIGVYDISAVFELISDTFYEDNTILKRYIKPVYDFLYGEIRFETDFILEDLEEQKEIKRLIELVGKTIEIKPLFNYSDEEVENLIKTLSLIKYLGRARIY